MNLYTQALQKFKRAYRKAGSQKLDEPSAMILATANRQGRPSARAVLLKEADERGFVFYTNFQSRKGKDLKENPWAALCFYWDQMDEQARIEGRVQKVPDTEADAYWRTRPRDSQIGAWASLQSSEMKGQLDLLKRVAQFAVKFGIKPIPRPPHWSGFRVVPDRFEFWTRKPFRLHERIVYEKKSGQWRRRRLYP